MDTNTDRFSKRHPVSVVTLNELREKETKLLKRTDLEIKCQCNIDGYNNFVFLNKEYRVHNQNTLNRALERIVRKCNEEIIGTGSSPDPLLLPRIQCHMLRHTYGTRLNDAGVNVKAMQEMLGHRDIDTTMRIYVDASENIISHAINEYEDMITKMFADAIPHKKPFPTLPPNYPQSSVKIRTKSVWDP